MTEREVLDYIDSVKDDLMLWIWDIKVHFDNEMLETAHNTVQYQYKICDIYVNLDALAYEKHPKKVIIHELIHCHTKFYANFTDEFQKTVNNLLEDCTPKQSADVLYILWIFQGMLEWIMQTEETSTEMLARAFYNIKTKEWLKKK